MTQLAQQARPAPRSGTAGRVGPGQVFPTALLRDGSGDRVPVVAGAGVVVVLPSRGSLPPGLRSLVHELVVRDVRVVALTSRAPLAVTGTDGLPGCPVLVDQGGQLLHVLGLDQRQPGVVVVDGDHVVTLVEVGPPGARPTSVDRVVEALSEPGPVAPQHR